LGATDSDQQAFRRACTLEAMRTQGAFPSFLGVATATTPENSFSTVITFAAGERLQRYQYRER
jgi:hypothetical protein